MDEGGRHRGDCVDGAIGANRVNCDNRTDYTNCTNCAHSVILRAVAGSTLAKEAASGRRFRDFARNDGVVVPVVPHDKCAGKPTRHSRQAR